MSVFDDPPAPAPTAWVWIPGSGANAARALLNLGSVRDPANPNPGQLRHARPYIQNGGDIFVFPGGTEGFRATGQAELGLHKYIGDNAVDAQVIHYEEGRIELTGTFAGNKSVANMVALRDLLMTPSKDPGLILYVPGVFPKEQFVLAENWEFVHTDDDRSHSIGYTLAFVRTGVGHRAADPHGTPPPPNPSAKIVQKGEKTSSGSGRAIGFFKAASGAQTLQQISTIVYGTADQWQMLMANNLGTFDDVPAYKIPTYRIPLGTAIAF